MASPGGSKSNYNAGMSCIGVESNDEIAPDGSGMIAEVLKGSVQRGISTHGEKPPINIPQTMEITQLNKKQGA
jgi:hypothetical protein